jgi:hypothetical protein
VKKSSGVAYCAEISNLSPARTFEIRKTNNPVPGAGSRLEWEPEGNRSGPAAQCILWDEGQQYRETSQKLEATL